MSTNNHIQRRLVLITGASGGIGAACAARFAAEGTHLALTYSTNFASIEALLPQLRKLQGDEAELRISVHQVNLEVGDDIARLFKEIQAEHNANVDILISNAGYGKRIQNIWDIPFEEFNRMINVNLTAAFLLAKGVVDGMRDQAWGRIIFISSIAAYGAGLNGCHHAASKGGLVSMAKNLSARLAEYNITVNDIAPAMVGSTGMLLDENSVPGLVDTIPLHRLCSPEEVANAAVMFATTGFATGQSLIISGGLR